MQYVKCVAESRPPGRVHVTVASTDVAAVEPFHIMV
jgi:hypothetical protein